MATNSQLLTTESKKKKLSKQQEQNHKYGDRLEGYQLGGGKGRMVENVLGIKSIISGYKIGGVKNSIGNGEVK